MSGLTAKEKGDQDEPAAIYNAMKSVLLKSLSTTMEI